LYWPGVSGAVAVIKYPPVEFVVVVTKAVLQLNTRTIVSPVIPTPFSVRIPETLNVFPWLGFGGAGKAVKEVETGLDKEPVLRFKVIEPGPRNVAKVGSFDPEQVKSPMQLQLDIV
jgi:hypothetical protein